jgi:hypothetical protein
VFCGGSTVQCGVVSVRRHERDDQFIYENGAQSFRGLLVKRISYCLIGIWFVALLVRIVVYYFVPDASSELKVIPAMVAVVAFLSGCFFRVWSEFSKSA